MKMIVSGGGTGGHIYPALAIIREVQQRISSVSVLFVGTKTGLESTLIPGQGIPFRTIDIEGIDRSSPVKAVRSILKIPASTLQARRIIREFQPDVIVGTGGYVSYPIVAAGASMGIKTCIHEQNAFPGLANRRLAKKVDLVMVAFPEAIPHLSAKRVELTGLPVRKEILALAEQMPLRKENDHFTLLAFGGSLGAESINRAMLELVYRYRNYSDIRIIWITGKGHYESMQRELLKKLQGQSLLCELQMIPYHEHIEKVMGITDLVICRAGASTVSELAVLGLPAILIPYPYAAENHQEKNARALVEKNAAAMLIDKELDGDTLYKKVESMRLDPDKLHKMSSNMLAQAKPDALANIADLVLEGLI
ncbi:MAG TPA: undecaprenyldiphospho-muramoylpentapeptide beta-N-acetylglucosaminyltransferase [Syntrophomonadaceae bacterium]|nr:undecaprenyldiphospho-muramoylpentapeptide beta-N-acetylglucosaminyltransferase [Syntrophomonadaceae bacterium]